MCEVSHKDGNSLGKIRERLEINRDIDSLHAQFEELKEFNDVGEEYLPKPKAGESYDVLKGLRGQPKTNQVTLDLCYENPFFVFQIPYFLI